jgi:hypothetical protein
MDLTFALLWMGIAGAHFYRFFRRNVDWSIYLGIVFLGVGYIALGFIRQARSSLNRTTPCLNRARPHTRFQPSSKHQRQHPEITN